MQIVLRIFLQVRNSAYKFHYETGIFIMNKKKKRTCTGSVLVFQCRNKLFEFQIQLYHFKAKLDFLYFSFLFVVPTYQNNKNNYIRQINELHMYFTK